MFILYYNGIWVVLLCKDHRRPTTDHRTGIGADHIHKQMKVLSGAKIIQVKMDGGGRSSVVSGPQKKRPLSETLVLYRTKIIQVKNGRRWSVVRRRWSTTKSVPFRRR